jgi:UDP-glucose 4-epimerase
MKILVTGGAGYIGSHTVAELLLAGLEVVVLDNYSNSSACALARVADIVEGDTGTPAPLLVIEGDVRDRALLDRLFAQHDIGGVIHFAGLKAVGESMAQPLEYYENNVGGSVTLCQAMAAAGVTRLVFSSSATVYGEEAPVPYVETQPRGRTSNPYGTSKAMVEQVLTDLCASNPHWSVALLRYFNPIGAHPSGRIGEDPQGIPNNLMPYIAQVAIGRREALSIFGNDYGTPDGTCRRDYLHVVDLAKGHLRALESLGQPGIEAYNLGTGQAYSVLEMVQAFEKASDRPVPYHFAPRRPGDLPAFWANPEKADRVLNWCAERSLDDMMTDTWRWQAMNPEGYRR